MFDSKDLLPLWVQNCLSFEANVIVFNLQDDLCFKHWSVNMSTTVYHCCLYILTSISFQLIQSWVSETRKFKISMHLGVKIRLGLLKCHLVHEKKNTVGLKLHYLIWFCFCVNTSGQGHLRPLQCFDIMVQQSQAKKSTEAMDSMAMV